jgi:hypothetical protein
MILLLKIPKEEKLIGTTLLYLKRSNKKKQRASCIEIRIKTVVEEIHLLIEQLSRRVMMSS